MSEKLLQTIPVQAVEQATKMGAEDTVCITTHTRTKELRFTNNQVISTNVYDKLAIRLFLAVKKRVISAKIDDPEQLSPLLNKLIKLAKKLPESKNYFGIANKKYSYPAHRVDKKIIALNEELIDFADEAIGCARRAGANRIAGVVYSTHSLTHLATSAGIHADDEQCNIEISVRAFADKNASGHDVSCATTLSKFIPAKAGEVAGEIAKKSLRPLSASEGKFDIVFHPLAAANLFMFAGWQSSAFHVDAGLSCLVNKLNLQVANEAITLYDDGVRDDGLGSKKFDDEGRPTRRTAVIEKGVLKSYLHNTSTAKKYKTESTSNAGLIVPQPWNLVLKPGKWNENELFSEIKKGLYITNLWYGRFQNYIQGDFSIVPRDGIFIIENGKISKPIKNIRISDNLLRMLRAMDAVGKTPEQVHWWEVNVPVFVPHVLVREVNITRSML